MEYYVAERKKKVLPFASAWMELKTIMIKWSKPVDDRQIPYDLTYNWNLMNKIN